MVETAYDDSNIGGIGGNEVLSESANKTTIGGLVGLVVGATAGAFLAREMNNYEIAAHASDTTRYFLDSVTALGTLGIGVLFGGVLGLGATMAKYLSN